MMAGMITLILIGLLRGIRTHRALLLKIFWTWKSRRNGPGRPAVAPEIRALIRQMSKANPLWGAPRIHGELQKLGVEISQAAVSRYVVRHRRPPSQTWRTFLDNHLGNLVSVDFFVVPTVLFKVLFVFVVLAHERRRVVHINVTDAPTAQWTAQQLVEAFPGRLPRDTSCAIAMRCTGSRSRGARSPWGSTKSRRRLGRLGRIRTWNVSSAPSAASVSTTVCHECRTEKGGNAAEEMRAGPSESGCRTRLQTPSRCVGQEPAW